MSLAPRAPPPRLSLCVRYVGRGAAPGDVPRAPRVSAGCAPGQMRAASRALGFGRGRASLQLRELPPGSHRATAVPRSPQREGTFCERT